MASLFWMFVGWQDTIIQLGQKMTERVKKQISLRFRSYNLGNVLESQFKPNVANCLDVVCDKSRDLKWYTILFNISSQFSDVISVTLQYKLLGYV